jgi:hypothetical protein
MLSSIERKGGLLREQTMEDIAGQMQRRGIRTSGIHAQALGESMRDIEGAAETSRLGAAADVYGLQQRDRQQAMNYSLGLGELDIRRQQMADARSEANQQRRAQTMGAVGSFLGNLFAKRIDEKEGYGTRRQGEMRNEENPTAWDTNWA